jgi:hypothetical protein
VRKSVLFTGVGVVVASLALTACGSNSSPSTKKAALKQFVASLGASPDVQVHLTGSFTGGGSSAKVQTVLKGTSLDVNVSNPSGAPLSQAGASANTELIFNAGGKAFLDVREVDGNFYLKVDLTALSTIPGTKFTPAEIAAAQAFLGGRWFELPKSLLHTLIGHSKVPKAQIASDQRVEAKVLGALANFIDTAHYTTLSNGFSESGTLKSVVTALTPTIQQFAHTHATSKPVKGTFKLSITTSGSTLTGGSISITAPNGTKGNATGTLTATVAHAGVSVTAPSSSTPITPQLLASFGLSKALGKG